jgi:5-methylcytosine-specific restriction enzyme subunit McrC
MLSLLFDMNKLWEEFVLTELRRIQEEENIIVKGQEENDFWGSNYLKPDIVISKGNKKYIINTKWKRPGKAPSISDLRQMYAYARFWDAECVVLLYPGVVKTKYKEFLTQDFHMLEKEVLEIKHKCKMGYVSVLDEDNNLSDKVGEQVLALLDEPSLFNYP